MTLFDNALDEFQTLLQCPLCKDTLKQTHTIGECSHHFCRDCIYPVLGVTRKCPTCGLPAIVKNLLRNPSYDTLVACTWKIRDIRLAEEVQEDQEGVSDDEEGTQPTGTSLTQQRPMALGTMQGTVLWSYDCGPTFPDTDDVALAATSTSLTGSATSATTFPSVGAVISGHLRERHEKEAAAAQTMANDTQDRTRRPSSSEATTESTNVDSLRETPSDKITILRQMLGMPAWKATGHLDSEELTQRTQVTTVGTDGEERPSTAEILRMPSPALGGYEAYVTAAQESHGCSYTPTMDVRDISPPSPPPPEPLPEASRKRRILIPPGEFDHHDSSASSKRPASAAVRKDREASPTRHYHQQQDEKDQPTATEFHPWLFKPTVTDQQSRRSGALAFLPLKGSTKTRPVPSDEKGSTTSVTLVQTHQQKGKWPVAVASRKDIDIDRDITSRVVDMDDYEQDEREGQHKDEPRQEEESDDEQPSLSHDDVWRCEWCKSINLDYIANEPNNVCDHCHRLRKTSTSPLTKVTSVSTDFRTNAAVEIVPPSDDEEDHSRGLNVVVSSQLSYDMQGGLTMPSRYPFSETMASLPESQEEGDAIAFRLTRQNAAIPSSSSFPSSDLSSANGRQRLSPFQEKNSGMDEISPLPSSLSQEIQQQQQQPHMVCCIFAGLRPEHQEAFDEHTTKLVETNLLMEQIADQDVSDRTTHIVTSAEEETQDNGAQHFLLCPRVIKNMYGLLSPAPDVWIVRYEWFKDSIHQGRWLPLPAMSEIYEVQGDTQFGPAPRVRERRQRRSQLGRKLFDGCKMFFVGDFTHKWPFEKKGLLRLVQYGGATIVTRKPHPPPIAAGVGGGAGGAKSKASRSAGVGSRGSGTTTQTTLTSTLTRPAESPMAAKLRIEAAEYFAPRTRAGDERPFLYVTEDIKPWEVPLDRTQSLIVCDPFSVAVKSSGSSVSGASTAMAVAMDRLTPGDRKKYGWLATDGYQAVSATWLLNCISCSLFGKGDMQALYEGSDPQSTTAVVAGQGDEGHGAPMALSSEQMLQELDDAWRQWRSSSTRR